jgi:hypothetical protein
VSRLRVLDELEARTEGYVLLEDAQRAAADDLSDLLADDVLLVDYRQRLDASGALHPVTLCRLNRHHPRVKALGGW